MMAASITVDDQRSPIVIEVLRGKLVSEIYTAFQGVCGTSCLHYSNVYCWYQRFSEGRTSIEDHLISGWLATALESYYVEKIKQYINDDRRMTCEEIASEVGVSHSSVDRIKSAQGCYTDVHWYSMTMCRSTNAVVTSLLTSCNWDVLEHPPYSSDMSPPDCDLFPKLKENLRGTRYESLKELKAAGAAQVRRINSCCLATGVAILPNRWQLVIKKQGHYFEGMKQGKYRSILHFP